MSHHLKPGATSISNIAANRPALEPKRGTTFNFVITSSQPFTTTNLTARVNFSRVVLEGGKLADVNKSVNVITR